MKTHVESAHKEKLFDAVILISFFIISTIFIVTLKLGHITTFLLYFGFPSFYLLVKYPSIRKRILFFAIPLAVAALFLEDYTGLINRAWLTTTIFPIKILGVIPLEDFIWGLLLAVLILVVYEVFVDIRHPNPRISKNYKWFIIMMVGVFIAFFTMLIHNPPRTSFAYFKFFLPLHLLPIIYIMIRHPNLVPKLIKISLIFFVFFLIYEIIGLHFNFWSFPGEYIATTEMFGVVIPLEELLLWVVLISATVVAWHEEFVDDLK